MESVLIAITPIVLLVGAFVNTLLSIRFKDKRLFDAIAVVFASGALILTALIAYIVFSGQESFIVYRLGGWPPPLGIVYVVDKLSAFMGVITGFIVLLVVAYSIGYLKEPEGLAYYYSLLLLLESALLGCYYTSDAFNFFVMLELMAVSAYALVAYHKSNGVAVEASFKYGVIAALAGILYFISLGFTYGYMGTLSIPDLSAKINHIATVMEFFSGKPPLILTPMLLVLGLAIWSFMLESAIFPLHFWLPDAHAEAPSPVSAVLSGLVVNAGLYGIARFLYTVFDITSTSLSGVTELSGILVVIASIGAVYSSIMMMFQDDVKRIIAYSTVMHTSLILIGVCMGTPEGVSASTYHFLTHSVSKSLAFLSFGFLAVAAGSRRITDLAGMGKIFPGVAGASIIAMLGLAGIPPLGTFPSKLMLITASIEAHHYEAALAIVLSSSLAAVTYFKLVYRLIALQPRTTIKIRPGKTITTTLWVLAITTILVGVLMPVLAGVSTGIGGELANPLTYIKAVTDVIPKTLVPQP